MPEEVQRSADLLVDLLLVPGVLDQVRAKPEETLSALAAKITKHLPVPAVVGDKLVYRIVVSALGLVAVGSVIGAIFLAARATSGAQAVVPDVLTALGAAAIGALAGLLAPSPASRPG